LRTAELKSWNFLVSFATFNRCSCAGHVGSSVDLKNMLENKLPTSLPPPPAPPSFGQLSTPHTTFVDFEFSPDGVPQ
jgi:hypothetical protein